MRGMLLSSVVALAVAIAACSGGETGGDIPQPTAATGSTTSPDLTATTMTAPTPEATTTNPPVPTPSSATTSSTTTTTLVPLDELALRLDPVAAGFSAPVFITSPPGDPRQFVVDQPGVVWVLEGGDPEVFLDIREAVVYGGERGLLGLAFDPAFADSGRFYVNYTGSGNDTFVSEFTVSAGEVDVAGERIVLRVDQPATNHNGGMIAFGPDGLLWIGMGDGGGSNDRFGNGQDGRSLLGSMLRIDPTSDPYTIPGDNPDPSGATLAAEVWAIGLRNPWRFAFDGSDLWIADVGQNAWEEINVVSSTTPDLNFGWPEFEGSNCHLSSSCDGSRFVAPVHEYPHREGCSITGGYVYRGAAIPELDGHYLFGDHCSGWIRGISPSGEVIEWFGAGTVPSLSSFGVDNAGEIYVMGLGGSVFRLARGDG